MLKQLINSDDAQFELHLVLGIVAFVIGVGLEIWDIVINKHQFEFQPFCAGAALLIAALGLAAAGTGLQRKLQNGNSQ